MRNIGHALIVAFSLPNLAFSESGKVYDCEATNRQRVFVDGKQTEWLVSPLEGSDFSFKWNYSSSQDQHKIIFGGNNGLAYFDEREYDIKWVMGKDDFVIDGNYEIARFTLPYFQYVRSKVAENIVITAICNKKAE